MKSGPYRSIIRGALLILAAAAAGCVGEVGEEQTVGEVLGEASIGAEAPAAYDVVPAWARDDGMAVESLRDLLADLAERAVRSGERDDVGGRAAEQDGAGWRSEPSVAPL